MTAAIRTVPLNSSSDRRSVTPEVLVLSAADGDFCNSDCWSSGLFCSRTTLSVDTIFTVNDELRNRLLRTDAGRRGTSTRQPFMKSADKQRKFAEQKTSISTVVFTADGKYTGMYFHCCGNYGSCLRWWIIKKDMTLIVVKGNIVGIPYWLWRITSTGLIKYSIFIFQYLSFTYEYINKGIIVFWLF